MITARTGYPVTITDGFSQAFTGGGANRPNLVAGCSNNPKNTTGDITQSQPSDKILLQSRRLGKAWKRGSEIH